MPQGQYSASDLQSVPPPVGQFTADDLAGPPGVPRPTVGMQEQPLSLTEKAGAYAGGLPRDVGRSLGLAGDFAVQQAKQIYGVSTPKIRSEERCPTRYV